VALAKISKEIFMVVQPEGEDLRKAVKWISEERQTNPEISAMKLVEKASLRFNLSPKDAEFLMRFVKGGK
jgi:hypothetical protein